LVSDIGESEAGCGLRNLVSRVKALVYLMADDYLLALREYGKHIEYNNSNSTIWTETHTLNQTYIFPNQPQLKVFFIKELFIKELFSNHNHNSYRNTKHIRDGINIVANNNKDMCLVDLRDLSDSIEVLKSSIERALNETLAVNLCSMYEVTYITHLDTN